jgi:acetylornithine deacetylase/succinyl-diaminopimelate desuccinylase-like protein
LSKTLVEITQETIDLAIAIQQIPSPTFSEKQRGCYLRELFVQKGLSAVEVDAIGNVYGCVKGKGSRPPAVFSAHLDTVFPETTNLSIRRTGDQVFGPGISDNALGLAGLIGLIELLQVKGNPEGDIWLVADVCEEGLGNLRGMEAVVNRFGDNVLAYIIVEGTTLGKIYHRALGVERYRIQAETAGGHSWSNFGRPSAIHELAFLAGKIARLKLPVKPRTTLNIGTIQGGFSVNTIAAEAHLELDLRSESAKALSELVGRVISLVKGANRSGDDFIRVQAERIGLRPAGELPSDHPLVNLAIKCLEEQGITAVLGIGSTDANIPLSRGLPAICVGLTQGSGAHTLEECMELQPILNGLQLLEALAEGVFLQL